jgi:hypothetical protein
VTQSEHTYVEDHGGRTYVIQRAPRHANLLASAMAADGSTDLLPIAFDDVPYHIRRAARHHLRTPR